MEEPQPSARQVSATPREHNLPVLLTRLVGRAQTDSRLAGHYPGNACLPSSDRGGIGKTSVSVAVAGALIPAYEHGVWVIDLSPLSDPRLVPSALAAALGLEIRSENPEYREARSR